MGSIVETQHGNVIRSTLIIQKVGKNNFGEYGCRVKNEMGEVSTVIKLKAVDALPLLIMVAAAIGGLLLTIVLIVIVITCRKVAKTPLNISPGAKTSPQPDRFSNSSSDTKANTISSLSAPDDLDGSVMVTPINTQTEHTITLITMPHIDSSVVNMI